MTEMTDRILVSGIKFHAYHGLTRLEREVGVRCSIDVEMSVDLAPAISSDRLGDTIDYRDVHRLVLEIGQDGRSFHLIESLAGRIAEAMLDRYPIHDVTVRVRKETPIIDGIVDYIGVQVVRRRETPSAARRQRIAAARRPRALKKRS